MTMYRKLKRWHPATGLWATFRPDRTAEPTGMIAPGERVQIYSRVYRAGSDGKLFVRTRRGTEDLAHPSELRKLRLAPR